MLAHFRRHPLFAIIIALAVGIGGYRVTMPAETPKPVPAPATKRAPMPAPVIIQGHGPVIVKSCDAITETMARCRIALKRSRGQFWLLPSYEFTASAWGNGASMPDAAMFAPSSVDSLPYLSEVTLMYLRGTEIVTIDAPSYR